MHQILITTYQEMIEHGLKFRMDDIATHLGMSKKTLYKMFDSKSDLVLAVITLLTTTAAKKQQSILDADIPLPQKLTSFLLLELDDFPHPSSLLARDIYRNHPRARKMLSQFKENRQALLKELLDQSVREQIIPPIPTSFVSDLLTSTATTIIKESLSEKHHMTFEESIKISVDLIAQGLLSNSHSQRYKKYS